MTSWKRTTVLALFVVTALRCATAPLAPPAEDREAKQFVAPPGLSRIYVVRPGAQGGAGLWQIIIDGVVQGGLPIQSFIVSDVPPGKHVVTASVESTQLTQQLETVADRVYFVRVGNFGRMRIDSDDEGRRAVLSSTRVVSAAPTR